MSKLIVGTYWFESSSSDKMYETLLYDDGSTSCDCPGWTRRAERTCKHTRAVAGGFGRTFAKRWTEAGNAVAALAATQEHAVKQKGKPSKETITQPGQRKIIMD